MSDLFLKFENQDQAQEELLAFGFYFDEEQGGLYHPNISLDLVGIISKTITDGNSEKVVTEPGYHINLRVMDNSLDLSRFDDFVVTPKTPVRVWA